MANKNLKSIKFPGLTDTYVVPQVDDTLTQTGRPADAKKTGDEIDALKEDLKTVDDVVTEEVHTRQVYDRSLEKAGYVTAAGVVFDGGTSYVYSPNIDVSDHVGDTLYFSANGEAVNCRFLTAYDSNGEVVEASGLSSGSPTYTIPNGIASIIITHSVNSAFQVELGGISPKVDYYTALIPKASTNYKGFRNGAVAISASADIPASSELDLTAFCAKQNKTISFYAKVGATFEGVRIGEGYGYVRGYNVHITSTGLSYQNGGTDGGVVSHGLTFKDYIGVVIYVDENRLSHVYIYTNGGTYKRETVNWQGSDSSIFVKTDENTILTGAHLSFTCGDTRKNIWYFGDSYITVSATRYPYYLDQMGYWTNVFADGFSGAGSSNIYPDAQLLIDMGIAPTHLVWALGMNDADTSLAVNSSWYARYSYISELCDKNGIELILATIPCTPTQNHGFKNALVRASGRRYIDFASAVNTAQDATTWYDGMLSNDNVHPTEAGAMALAQAVLSDFPEITMKYA